jgi:hypothetical protein
MGGVRRGAAAVYKVLIAVFAAAVVVQFFLAGLGIFGARPEEGESVTQDKFEDEMSVHGDVGWFLFLGTLLLLIVILIAWTGPRSIGATFLLAVLAFIQMALPSGGDVVAALHPVNAVVILSLALFLTWRAWRGNLLTPPSQLRGYTAAV